MKQVEATFIDGKAGASSLPAFKKWGENPPFRGIQAIHGFQSTNNDIPGWISKHQGSGTMSEIIWYKFTERQWPTKISFQPLQWHDDQKRAKKWTPTKFQFVGTKANGCKSDWKILCEQVNRKNPLYLNETRQCGIQEKNLRRSKYKCLGLKVKETNGERAAVSNIRIWVLQRT